MTDDPRIEQYEREREDAINTAHRAMQTSYIGAPPPGLRGDADRMVAALINAGWTPPSEPVTEHAVRMSDGDMCVRNTHPAVARRFPLDQWIPAMQNVHRTTVYKRRVIVVDDWTEVPRIADPVPPRRSVFDTSDQDAYWASRNEPEG